MFDSLQPTAYSLQPAACPEDRLILLLCRGHLTPELEAEARELLRPPSAFCLPPSAFCLPPSALSWSLLLARAIEQEILPLFRRNLETLGFPGVPADARARMNDLCRANTARQLLLVEELRRLLGLLDSAGIPAIPLKGPWLAQRLYGDYTLRVCSDLDLMVPPDRVVEAVYLLEANGYHGVFTPKFFERYLAWCAVEHWMRSERQVSIVMEFHWRVFRTPRADRQATRSLWAEAKPAPVFDAPAWSMSPRWERFLLVQHAASNYWQQLKSLADLEAYCGWSFERPVAAQFKGAVSEASVPAGARLQLLGPGPWSFCPDGGGLLDRLLAFLWLSVTPTRADCENWRLPAVLHVLYFALRPLRLTCKWAWRLLQAMLPRQRRVEHGLEPKCVRPAALEPGVQ